MHVCFMPLFREGCSPSEGEMKMHFFVNAQRIAVFSFACVGVDYEEPIRAL